MSALSDVKDALRITHTSDDTLLLRLIGSATREYIAFTNPTALPPDPAVDPAAQPDIFVPEDAFNGVVLMVQADYDADPLKRQLLRNAAEALWVPYRTSMGV